MEPPDRAQECAPSCGSRLTASVAALQVPEPSGDVHSHGRGVGRLPGFGVGWREQSHHQQL